MSNVVVCCSLSISWHWDKSEGSKLLQKLVGGFINAMQHFAPAADADAADARDREARAFVAAFLAKCLKVGGFFRGGGDDEDEVLVVGALEHLGWMLLAAEFAFPLDFGTPRISWPLWSL